MAAAAVAIGLANSPLGVAYHDVFHAPLPWTPVAKLNTVHLWINDAVMAVFFLVVGLEIKREILGGALRDPQQRRMPIAAAVAGMAVPAAIYVIVTAGEPALARGWAIPAATDIAFALGVLALVGRGLPPSLRLFLLTVAIVDDLGAVLIIAVFYTAKLYPLWLGAAAVMLVAMILLGRTRRPSAWMFCAAALALWYCVLNSGLHATVAGVLAAMTVPFRPGAESHDSMLLRMEHGLVPWNGFVVVPLFGFANAGVAVGDPAALLQPLPLGIAAGLVVGKLAGVLGALWLAARTGFAAVPENATWPQLLGVSALCGIGFTMSLFIGGLAFPAHPELFDGAKLGILGGSLVAAVAGFAILSFASPARPG